MTRKYALLLCILLSAATAPAQKNSKPNFDTAPNDLKQVLALAEDCMNAGGEDCSKHYHEALQLSKKKQYKAYIGTLYGHLMRSFYMAGQDDSTLFYAKPALDAAIENSEYYNLAVMYNLVGAAYMNGASTDAALRNFQKAKEYILKINDSVLLAENYSNTAGVYVDIKDDKRALEEYNKGYAIATNIRSEQMIGIMAVNIAECYARMHNYLEAKSWAYIAQKNATAANFLPAQCFAASTLSEMHLELGAYDSASYFAMQAIDYGKQLADDEFLATAYETLARSLLKRTLFKEALEAARESIALNESVQNYKSLTRVYKVAADASYSLREYKSASDYYNNMLDLMDTVLSDQNQQAVQDVREKYETEKKERLLAEKELTIERKNAQMRLWSIVGGLLLAGALVFLMQYRKTQKARLAKAEKEKENAILKAWMNGEERERNRISQELHDGVAAMLGAAKMNLQAIPHLSQEKQTLQLQKVSTILENTHVDVRRIAHNLLPITLQKEGLINAVKQFASDINDTGILKITIENSFHHLAEINAQTQLMLFRIVQELINNTLKHSSASQATIRFSGSEREIEIEITDNGKGFSPQSQSDSQGLFSIRQRLQALGGAFNIDSKEGEGTTALLRIALSKN